MSERKSRKIKIICDGQQRVTNGTRVIDQETGEDLRWVRRVEVTLDARGMPHAVLYIDDPELEIEIDAELRTEELAAAERVASEVEKRVHEQIARLFERFSGRVLS
jgi:hypothetical protein